MMFPAVFDTSSLNGNNGFTLTALSGAFGFSVACLGDINDDGTPDLIVGAPDTKQSFVIFGADTFPVVFDISNLNGTNGFTIISSSVSFGQSLAGIGDINGDGKSDLIVGARTSNKVFVIFGASNFPAIFDTASLNGNNGFTLIGLGTFGFSVAGIGDINVDGIADLIVGANSASKAFIVFGTNSFPAIFDVSNLNGTNGFTLVGPTDKWLGISVSGIGDVNGDSKPDLPSKPPELPRATPLRTVHAMLTAHGSSL